MCKIWDSKSGEAILKLSAHKGNAFWASYNQSGDMIVTSGSDKIIYLWDKKNTKKPLKKLIGNADMVRSVVFFNNDESILSGSTKGEISIFDAKSGDLESQNLFLGEKDEHEGNIIYCVRSMKSEGNSTSFMTTHADCVARSWEYDPSSKDTKIMNEYIGHSDTVRYIGNYFFDEFIDFSPSEKRIVTACEDHSLRVWDTEEVKGQYLLSGHHDFAVAADFIDETTLLSASWDQTIKLWKLPS